ncbi:(2Fe-2S)-binding protein [Pseudalkalibacillus salsuginis]|uniref:(2Fe-2S)-binding protein n=1 Tax=Pseudalkalibacillus salsuginis TaxID=2910972 RepID=UPI001F3D56FD|nr:(2Fe-2S)-binding protein [Pseudalkalibacillus salsuginis]MCF6410023.1 (2Fe-2S)-binding protein [Pseudalkalibacillus salsuginis]
MNKRIINHPILDTLADNKEVSFSFNGKNHNAVEGDTIASALLANGICTLRYHEESGNPRGVYCNIGHCFECRVKVGNSDIVRACLTPVEEGMKIETLTQYPTPLKGGS